MYVQKYLALTHNFFVFILCLLALVRKCLVIVHKDIPLKLLFFDMVYQILGSNTLISMKLYSRKYFIILNQLSFSVDYHLLQLFLMSLYLNVSFGSLLLELEVIR